ncbi:MAG: glycoside hydrolase family 31 protein [Polyangiales bacterium]
MRPTRLALALAPLCLAACDDPAPAPRDGATDAPAGDVAPDFALDVAPDAPTRSATVRVEDARARVTLTAGPRGVAVRVTRPDGTPWFESPRDGTFLEVGTAPGGPSPTRAPDTRAVAPNGITWVTPAEVTGEDPARGSVTFALGDAGPLTVTLSRVAEGVYRVESETAGRDAAMLRWALAADGGQYHGLGERFGEADAKGSIVPMQFGVDGRSDSGTNEHHVPVPFFVSTRSYGVFVESRMPGAFDVGAADPARVTATFEGARASVYLYVGDRPSTVVAAYTRQTGLPRLPPRWVYGPMHWRNEWRSRDELMEDARRVRAEGIPTTTIWIDNPWQRSYNDCEFDTARFPDPPGLFRELQRMGFRVLVWSTPYLDFVEPGATPRNTAEMLYQQARDRGHLVRFRSTGEPYVSVTNPGSAGGMPDSRGALIDFTSPAATDFWTGRLEPLVALGVRGFKLDYGEDIVTDLVGARPGFLFASGEDERTGHHAYPQGYHRAYQNALMRGAGGDGFLLVRASSWGGQRVADVVWPGDLDNDFRRHELANGRVQVGGLPASIHAMVSLAASGFPNYGADTGGYRGGRPTREVLLRWAEHTAFSPILQLGGGGESHNPWSYDEAATAIYRDLARVHADLVPYLRAHAVAASRDGTPPLQALALAFPDDPGSLAERDAWLLGDDLYVAPVVTAGATSRRVHVPPGTWVHWYTGEAHSGPADVDVAAPLGRPPVFLRQGAIVPMYAGDVATLAATDATDVVDFSDRQAILRARVIPAGSRSFTVEDGTRIEVSETKGLLRLAFTPGTESRELRAELDLAHRSSGTSTAPTSVVREGGAALTMAPDAATVAAGCDGCWHHDAATRTLRVSVRGAATVVVR